MKLIEQHPWTDKDVERHWDDVADIYVDENHKVSDAHNQRFLVTMEHLRLTPGMKILNVTSRDCELDDFIRSAQPDVEVINAEISSGLMGVAAKLRPQAIQVKLAGYSQLPFADGEFDAVVSLEALEHVAQPVAFLRELRRVAKADSQLILSCPPRTSEPGYRVYTALCGGHGEGPHRFPWSGEVKKMFVASGWKLEKHFGTVLMPVGPGWWRNGWERILKMLPFLGEFGIRQFFVAHRVNDEELG